MLELAMINRLQEFIRGEIYSSGVIETWNDRHAWEQTRIYVGLGSHPNFWFWKDFMDKFEISSELIRKEMAIGLLQKL